ncbi:App1 family protein [Brachybacterium sp. NPDC056505]|uniref:App1 family protein n=1 Tax=Brachybacterium sp. NPDC056505 TaxID=3345843 RepID=UPI00366B87B4
MTPAPHPSGPQQGRLQPHWSARIENVKNAVVSGVLDTVGWVLRIKPFTGFGTPGCVRIIARVLWARPSAPADYHDQPVWDMRSMAVRGWRSFISQVAPHQDVRIHLDGREYAVRSDRSGLVDVELDADLPPGVHIARIATTTENTVTAEVHVHSPDEAFGVVSDIDDTVVVTWLPRPLLAFWNAFVIPQTSRRAVAGMAMLYQRIARAHTSAPFVYLSTGAWNVFPVLQRFLYKNGYPDGPLLLTDWGPTNTGFFRSGRAHKERTLETLVEQFPHARWLLIGDDGQHDPAIYAAFARAHPENVAAVAIRELTEPEQVLSSGLRARRHPDLPADSPVVWVQGADGHALLHGLRREGIVP